jgi:polyisoprenoid-binding protein YceI
MKRSLRSATWLLILFTALPGSGRVWSGEPFIDAAPQMIDPHDVDVRFKVRVFGLISIVGHFDRLLGAFENNDQGQPTGVRVQIEADSVTTDDAWRDEYLRGPSFFATDRYPHITFSGSCVGRGENGAGRVVGHLSMRGRSRRVVFAFEPVASTEDSDQGLYRAKTVIRRSEFGLDALRHVISDEVEITVAMQTASSE